MDMAKWMKSVEQRLSELDRRIRGGSTDWIYVGITAGAPAFQNGWINYTDGTFGAARFRRLNGVVYMNGLIQSGTLGAVIFNLPVGFRPAAQTSVGRTGLNLYPANSDTGIGRFDIEPNGNVIQRGGGNAFFSLAAGIFPAEQ